MDWHETFYSSFTDAWGTIEYYLTSFKICEYSFYGTSETVKPTTSSDFLHRSTSDNLGTSYTISIKALTVSYYSRTSSASPGPLASATPANSTTTSTTFLSTTFPSPTFPPPTHQPQPKHNDRHQRRCRNRRATPAIGTSHHLIPRPKKSKTRGTEKR
ncbi:hypothetical protein BDV95DRAFT_582451 [Massariosphaeria phaeospora]|uniref:Uncharacterized protein n=1 Tax=Massariosphaeria phaeospora TaxID=100035 RepID=A0A7C8MHA8_9PLEO|nr:hypothetical protein BDV95DRAFT_582451 [Massariosphaeria phaeospora]